ncbi:MAG: response regulator transcription factor [Bacteroidota bacterium]
MADLPIRIALVDDQKLFRSGLKLILNKQANFKVIFEAGDGQQFFERLNFEPVDLVILDVEMPVMDGMATLARLKADHPAIKVLMLTMHESGRLITHLMQAGANGFLLKDEEPEVVCRAVEQVMRDGMFFRDYVSKALLKGNQRQTKTRSSDALLRPKISERELEVLQLICQEYTSQEIAKKLFISVRTIDGHRRSLQEKTGAKNIAGLVLYAVNNDLV